MTKFSDLGLSAPILEALTREGYESPTPIQVQAIPPVLVGRDLLGIAQTGTGKTAAFALPMIQRLAADKKAAPRKGCRALILSPTRELASQIEESFRAYGRGSKLTSTVVFGGVPVPRQERALHNGVDILVATPGRLLDLIDRRSLSLSNVEILVLDEADQMLDLGFIHALRRIVTLLPKSRQTLFFSATMPAAIAGLANGYLSDPVKVSVAPVATTAERVEQRVTFVSQGRKQALLEHILHGDAAIERVLVFTRTKHGADKVVRGLEKAGVNAFAIHGNKSQGQRERALGAFKTGACKVLVATDIAARGIDVEAVSHVVNFDIPNVPEQYVHRIGRTARAGASGIALAFCNEEERAYLRDIQKLTRQTVPVAEAPAGFDLGGVEALSDEPAREPRRDGRGRSPQRGRGGPGGGGAKPAQGRPAQGRPAQGQGRPAQGQGQGRPGGQAQQPKRAEGGQRRDGGGGRDGSSIGWLSGGKPAGERPRRGR